MSSDSEESVRSTWGLIAAAAGLTWALSPAAIMLVDLRIGNGVYLLPLALMFGTLYSMGDRIASSSVSLLGYLITGLGVIIVAVGSVMEAVFQVGALAQRGLAQGQVYYLGLLVLLLGALFLGAGLWRDGKMRYVGPAFVIVLPVTVAGFYLFDVLGLAALNWIPITVPYGLAWIGLGYDLWQMES